MKTKTIIAASAVTGMALMSSCKKADSEATNSEPTDAAEKVEAAASAGSEAVAAPAEKVEAAAEETIQEATSAAPSGFSQDDVIDKSMAITEKYADIMESVKDADSGKAALEKFDSLISDYEELGNMSKNVSTTAASNVNPAELQSQMMEKMKPVQERLQKASMGAMQVFAANPELMQQFQEKSMELATKMQAASGQ